MLITPHCSLLGTQARLKGHLSDPGARPLLSPCPRTRAGGEGPGRAALGSSWLRFAGRTVINGAKLPIPSQNTAMLGEALYSQRQTTHICFLTVGIAPTGTERTGSLLSPSPCDCELCAEQCVANTILPGLSWALVDTWSVCPSPDQPKSPHASPARMQNVLPGSPASRSLQSCSVLSCLSEPPRWTQNAASAGGRQQLFASLSNRAGKAKLQGATGGRAAHSGYSSPGSEGEQIQAWKISAQHGHKDQVTMNLQGRCQVTSQTGGLWRPPAYCRAPKYRSWQGKLSQALALLRVATLERCKGQPTRSRTCP